MGAMLEAIAMDGVPRRRLWPVLIAAAVAAMLAIGVATWLTRAPRLAADSADGSYRSDCCGTISLHGGRMTANEVRWAGYSVQVDERGPFILPDRWVGAADQGIILDGSRPVEKIRLDNLPRPTRIVLPGNAGPILFVRRAPANPLRGRR